MPSEPPMHSSSLPDHQGRPPLRHAPATLPPPLRTPAVIHAPPAALPEAANATDADGQLHASLARASGGVSPLSMALAQADWALHLMASPAKWQQLLHGAAGNQLRLLAHVARSVSQQSARPPTASPPPERRFRHPAWRAWPYSMFQQSYLLNRQWWHSATRAVPGMASQHEQLVGLMTQQLLDLYAPSNHVLTSPDVLDATLREGGQNFVRGAINLLTDLDHAVRQLPPPGTELFVPGKQVALARGKVILRNRLIELLQYQPLTDDVHPHPLLVVPAWDSKYYLLDLARPNSLISHLVRHGHTVFLLSWHNPQPAEVDLTPDSYLAALTAATAAVNAVVPGQAINGVGYGTGATLLAMAAASDGAPALRSLSLLAPRTDFTAAGELAQRSDASTAARVLHDYLLGQRAPLTGLDAWQADRPRVPYRLQAEQLRALLPDEDLSTGRLRLHGRLQALHTLRTPLFVMAPEHAPQLPWHGAYQLKRALETTLTFVLAAGDIGNAVLSVPGPATGHFRSGQWLGGAPHDDAPRWYADTAPVAGSWWPTWLAWLAARAPAAMVAPPPMGAPDAGYAVLAPAPGDYVLEH